MSPSRNHPRARLDAWRAQGADRLHPVRFHFIDALERRAASHEGEARRLLDGRLSQLLAAYADELDAVDAVGGATTPCPSSASALAELTDELSRRGSQRSQRVAVHDTQAAGVSHPPMDALDDLQKIWSTVRIESQLRQALEQVPADAGPLNSASLVHRSLTLMRELSPEYLQQFLSYVDALSWIEQLRSSSSASGKNTVGAGSPGKRSRRKPR
ncbi:DUF2894 domain-containing protein [Rhodanobacter sp. AS-Z3]|uniref:DUF2894 domain-containing protein n=1 Tax=Rhodanobacter sp. AS-Z3 TaxID=3031330 RepID=UPI0024797886|nr:DUF2894 domain-containing protein [Rhodanobacter sp. AS-Z3]WEN16739.1 DUF2894 domain-containing protein [Rhodanobacter sp. AS-Z3]